ncbi:putative MFS family arabinose efflux permease [Rhodobacter aestuarii]|uniref:Predicted arabinose efflux permease, MFS family n=1 Tax=Rhodobacter aestuarii TaxID=453582 RepID=A0A1N7IYU3_9RHOB|nr:MFS transporter [Rhodobacter aestuarii]PTV97376.1 putative MFS family arabinose efflux permease [Rhodobacter aestuarii]SIS42214.1 Predicted arabinose efflux permease, MFS family [Rhodobacter aestuarii]
MTPHAEAPPVLPLVIVAAATCLSLIVFTQPLTTLEAMTQALSLGAAEQAWVMSAMPLGAACGLLTAGALGDTTGRRRTFLGGLWLTAMASVLAAVSVNGPMLIAMRILQGLGSAGIMACGLGLLGQVYHGAARQRAAAIWAAGLGAGVALGPILASLLLRLGGWPAMHWLLALVSASLALAAAARLPESARTGAKVDLAGSLVLMLGLGALLYALTEARLGATPTVGIIAAAGVVLMTIFVVIERRVPNPILRVDLFGRVDFLGATLAAFASGAGVLALMSLVPTVLVRGFGETPFEAALILLAWSAVTVFAALGTGYLPKGLTARQRAIGAILGCTLGQLLMLRAAPGASWAAVLPGLFVAGVSNGLLNTALGHAAVATVPPERAAMGSAANNTARYLGSALGIALVSVLIAGRDGADFFAGWHVAVLASAGLSLLGVLALAALRGKAHPVS